MAEIQRIIGPDGSILLTNRPSERVPADIKYSTDSSGNSVYTNKAAQRSGIRTITRPDGTTAYTNREPGTSIFEGGQPYMGAGSRTQSRRTQSTSRQNNQAVVPKQPEYTGLNDMISQIKQNVPVYQQLEELGFKCNNDGVWMYKNDTFKVYCKIGEDGYTFQSMPLAQNAAMDAFYQRVTLK